MKNFHTLFEDAYAVEKAKKLGLEFQSHSVWKDPKTNKEWKWDGSNFVPYKGSSIGSDAGNHQTPVPDTLIRQVLWARAGGFCEGFKTSSEKFLLGTFGHGQSVGGNWVTRTTSQ